VRTLWELRAAELTWLPRNAALASSIRSSPCR
jgi:hypothetical protein